MEEYRIPKLPRPLRLGDYKDLVYNKHCNAYEKESADNILKTASYILKSSFKQESDIQISNNSLLVGKVQSGKTSNLEMLTALSFDNDYNVMIIYGGYDKDLLQQCVDRFTDTFDINIDDKIFLLSTNNDDFEKYDDNFFESKFDDNKKIIIASLKRPNALQKVNSCLRKIHRAKIKAFIIDDEGDQASLNTEFKKDDASATYREICEMKRILKNPLYYSVTATPQANIFQPDISSLKPDTIHLIYPANSYDGAEVFHLNESNIFVIPSTDDEDLDEGIFVDSLKNSISYFIIASAIMRIKGVSKSDMIVHSYREIIGHKVLYDMINNHITDFKDSLNNNDEDGIKFYINEIKKIYNDKYFSTEVLKEYPWNINFEKLIKKVVKTCDVFQQNSENKYDKNVLKNFNHKIYIGGDLLQRGITFKNLVTTYFTRWSTSGNMDTSLQRARWFGYRSTYIDLCKVFTTKEIKVEFANLASIEDDLWHQFELVENRELDIKDIIIDASSTSLNPTRKNVADYVKAKFAKKWNNQMYIITDANIAEYNNKLFDELIANVSFNSSSVGRNDSKISTHYAYINASDFIEMINKSKYIFENNPFNKEDLIKQLGKDLKVCIEMMTSFDDLLEERIRTFVDGKITALQQGADTTDKEKQHYLGDSSVIVDNDATCIQVFKILPKIDEIERNDLKQYMYAIHFPKKIIVYESR